MSCTKNARPGKRHPCSRHVKNPGSGSRSLGAEKQCLRPTWTPCSRVLSKQPPNAETRQGMQGKHSRKQVRSSDRVTCCITMALVQTLESIPQSAASTSELPNVSRGFLVQFCQDLIPFVPKLLADLKRAVSVTLRRHVAGGPAGTRSLGLPRGWPLQPDLHGPADRWPQHEPRRVLRSLIIHIGSMEHSRRSRTRIVWPGTAQVKRAVTGSSCPRTASRLC